MRANIVIANSVADEKEYMKMLKFCGDHGIYCFEFYYRHRMRKADRQRKAVLCYDGFESDRE